jgi:hypothetical protein
MRTFISFIACFMMAACATKPVPRGPVQLGDSERTMVGKMGRQGARDVTGQTSSTYVASISWNQRYYWWEFPDKTIAAVLVAAPPKQEMKVIDIETSEPGLGVEGIKNWRSQKLNRQTTSDSR